MPSTEGRHRGVVQYRPNPMYTNSRTAITAASSETTSDPLMSRNEYRYRKYENVTIAIPPRSAPSVRIRGRRLRARCGQGGPAIQAEAGGFLVHRAAGVATHRPIPGPHTRVGALNFGSRPVDVIVTGNNRPRRAPTPRRPRSM